MMIIKSRRKKTKIVFLLLICSFTLSYNNIPESAIVWSSERNLQWTDFQGRPIVSSPHDASSSVGVSYRFNSKSNTIEIYAVFHPRESWVKKNETSQTLLKHEQGHFDITELYSRKLRQTLSSKKFKKKSFQKEFQKIYSQVVKDMEQAQRNYDIETDFSKNEEGQSFWYKKITLELETLQKWRAVEISLVMK